MVSTGSSNSRLVNWDHGTVGVGDKMGVEVEGADVAIAKSIGTSVANSGNRSGSNERGNNGKSSSSIGKNMPFMKEEANIGQCHFLFQDIQK